MNLEISAVTYDGLPLCKDNEEVINKSSPLDMIGQAGNRGHLTFKLIISSGSHIELTLLFLSTVSYAAPWQTPLLLGNRSDMSLDGRKNGYYLEVFIPSEIDLRVTVTYNNYDNKENIY